ncbi:DUF4003 family protein [Vallitaleaceae bacterium 9-2]
MKKELEKRCQQFIENRDKIKEAFVWNGGLIHLACAAIFTANNKTADIQLLFSSKQMLKQQVGPFSNFRNTAQAAIISMLAVSDYPGEYLEEGLDVYAALKKRFWSSTHLALAAMVIAQLTDKTEYMGIVERTRSIYDLMKSEHPFLTGSDDSAYCALMALSDKSDDALLEDAQIIYTTLKEHFFSANAVQSLSHVLALAEGEIEKKVERTIELYRQLKLRGYKYGTSYELPTLGVLALGQQNITELVEAMIEVDTWLSKQKGFGFFSGVTNKQRLMYAGMLVGYQEDNDKMLQTATLNSTVSIIIAQQAAMMAAIAAGSASAAASN